jgi:hypothetical protein
MAARLGNVLYWAAILLALIHVGLAIHVWAQAASDVGAVWALVAFGVIIFLIGRAFRYVLSKR